MPPFGEIAQAAAVFLMLSANVIGAGLLITRMAKLSPKNAWVAAAAVGGAGLSFLGYEMWILGYLSAWNQLSFCISSAIMLLAIVLSAKSKLKNVGAIEPSFFNRTFNRKYDFESSYLTLLVAATVIAAVIVCFGPSINVDETAYHWPAPQLWASMHHWIASPYRFTNGPSFVELSYLPSALFHSATAGHSTHFLMWIVLLISACALGTILVSPALPTIAAVMACPVITVQAASMANDVGATSYLISALAILFSLKNNRYIHRHIVLVAIVFCGALSSKQPFAFGIIPTITLYLWFGIEAENAKERIVRVLCFLFPCLITEAFWLIHTYSLIGKFIDIPVAAVWTSSTQPTNPAHPYTGVLGLAGPPSIQKTLVLLATPFVSWMIGNQEPFGNRTGLLVPLFLPVFLLLVKKCQPVQKVPALWLFATAAVYYVSVGIFVVRTRYHIAVWVIWSLLASFGYTKFKDEAPGKKRFVITTLFLLTVTLGCVDSCRTLLQGNSGHALLPQVPWLLK